MLATSRDGFWERHLASGELWLSSTLQAMLAPGAGEVASGLDACEAFIHPDDAGRYAQALAAALAGGGAFEHEARFMAADFQWRWMRCRGQVWCDADGRPERICGTLRDVGREHDAVQALAAQQLALEALVRERTADLEAALALAEQRRREAEHANMVKSRFLAHMSHEIRTPLAGMLGLTELALRAAPAGPVQRHLKAAHGAGQTLLQVVGDVLEFSRVESGAVELRPRVFNPAEALAEAMRSVMPLVRTPVPALGLLYDWIGPAGWVSGDEGALRQVATNLLGNAIKFTERGDVTLLGRADALADGRCQLTVTVRDTGPGIPEALRERVFEPFVQGDAGHAGGRGGAGLGLAIARRLVQAMGGELCVDCPPGGGSIFTFTVVMDDADAPADEPAAEPGRPGLAWLVYPCETPARWAAARLQRLGWRTHTMQGLDAALALARLPRTPRPDLVLLTSAVLTGTGSLQALRAALPDAAVHLLVRTDWFDPELERQAELAGVALQTVPLTPRQLHGLGATRPAVAGRGGRHGGPALRPARVLLVEDNAVNQLVGQEFLRTLGLDVRLAVDGASALDACVASPPELVLMDLEMPGMDGLQAARQLRHMARQGLWPGAPIVALTAHASAAERVACRAAGMDAVLTKPLSLPVLRKRLARWLAA